MLSDFVFWLLAAWMIRAVSMSVYCQILYLGIWPSLWSRFWCCWWMLNGRIICVARYYKLRWARQHVRALWQQNIVESEIIEKLRNTKIWVSYHWNFFYIEYFIVILHIFLYIIRYNCKIFHYLRLTNISRILTLVLFLSFRSTCHVTIVE